MPDLNHLWQRFVLASALVFGLAVGVAATVFGYSNTAPVDVGFSVLHLHGIPLWTVALVPLAFLLVAGTVYHWLNNLHHFSEHMRHRRRVRDLEEEVKSLRAHLDKLLEIPDQSGAGATPATPAMEAPQVAETAVVASTNGEDATGKRSRKRATTATASQPEPEPASVRAGAGEATDEPETLESSEATGPEG